MTSKELSEDNETLTNTTYKLLKKYQSIRTIIKTLAVSYKYNHIAQSKKWKNMNISVRRLHSISLFIAWLLEQQDISDDSKIQYLERNDQGCNSPSRLHGTSTRIEGAAGLNILNNVRVFLEMKY